MPNDREVPSASRPLRLRLRYLFGLIAAALALPIVVWLVWGWIESARLDRALDELEARKEPLDIADFEPKPQTPEQREASHLYSAANKAVGGRTISSIQTGSLAHTIEELCSGRADTSAASSLRQFEAPFSPALALLDRATALDAAGWDDSDRPQRSSVEQIQTLYLLRVNAVRIARLACTGEGAASADALLATLRSRRVDAPMMPFPFQTPHGLHAVLTCGGASPAQLAQIQQEYATAADERGFETRVLRYRATWLSLMLPGVFGDAPPGYGTGRITPIEGVARKLARPLRDHRVVAELHEFEEGMEVAKQPWPVKLAAVSAFAQQHPARRSQSFRPGIIDWLTRPFGPHAAAGMMLSYLEGTAETLARTRASIGAVAVARYRSEHPGAMPTSLQSLVPDYLAAPLIDPYTGAELKYRVDGATYKVYSVGINRQDDGGSWELHSDLQWARRGNPPDIGIAVDAPPTSRRD